MRSTCVVSAMTRFSMFLLLTGFVSCATTAEARRTNVFRRQTESNFVDRCVSFLLSTRVVQDGLISQNEFASFLTDYCITQNVCGSDANLQFTELSVQLQLAFVLSVCDESTEAAQLTCLENLNGSQDEFGYAVSGGTTASVNEQILGLCSTSYPLAVDMGLVETTAPAATPTSTSNPPQNGTPSPSPVTAPSSTTPGSTPVPVTSPSPTPVTAPSPTTPGSTPAPVPSGATPTPSPPGTGNPSGPTATPGSNYPVTSSPASSPVTSTPSSIASPGTLLPTTISITSSPTPVNSPSNVPVTVSPATSSLKPVTGASTDTPSASPSEPRVVGGVIEGPDAGGDSNNVSGNAIAGISAASAAIVVGFLLLAGYRRRRSAQEKKGIPLYDIQGDESIFTEDSVKLKFGPAGMELMADTQSLKSVSGKGGSSSGSQKSSSAGSSRKGSNGSDSSLKGTEFGPGTGWPHNVRSVAQYDPSSAAAIALLRRGEDGRVADSTSSLASSRMDSHAYSLDMEDAQAAKAAKQRELDAAIEVADWSAVAKLAGSIANSEELSTVSGVSSIVHGTTSSQGDSIKSVSSSSRKSRATLSPEDEALASQLDDLIERGDWNAVAAAAGQFSTEKTGDRSVTNDDHSFSPERRYSFIDFVTGRRTVSSTAAAAAMVSAGDEYDRSTTAPVGLPPGQGASAAVAAAAAAAAVPFMLQAGRSNTLDTQSSSSHGEGTSPAKIKARAEIDNAGVETTDRPDGQLSSEQGAVSKGWIWPFWRRPKPNQGAFDDSSTPSQSAIQTSNVPIFERTPSSGGNNTSAALADISFSTASPIAALNSQQSISFEASSASMASLLEQLDEAVARSDWKAVEALSARIEAAHDSPRRMLSLSSSTDNDDNILGAISRSAMLAKVRAYGKDDSSEWDTLKSPTDMEDYTLGAASRSSVFRVQSPSSDVSIIALRTELDRAVERGDWPAVEDLSSQILSMNVSPSSKARYMILSDSNEATSPPSPNRSGLPVPPRQTPKSLSPSRIQISPSVAFYSPQQMVSGGSMSLSPSPDKEKSAKIDMLIRAGDWKGVHVLAGLYEMEASGLLSSTSAEPTGDTSFDSNDRKMQYGAWLGAEPAPDQYLHTTSDHGRPGSPSASSTSSAVEQQTLQEFERFVDAKDWMGLAAFAGGEVETDEDALERQRDSAAGFQLSPTSNSRMEIKPGEGGLSLSSRKELERKKSLHGATVLIPYWEDKIHELDVDHTATPERKAQGKTGGLKDDQL